MIAAFMCELLASADQIIVNFTLDSITDLAIAVIVASKSIDSEAVHDKLTQFVIGISLFVVFAIII